MLDSPGRYHSRHPDKALSDRAALLAVIRTQKHLTLALCSEDRPYLVTVNYGFAEAEDCFYLHCSLTGRKADLIRANAHVYGQVLDDRGYLAGECDHAYATVQFEGEARFVDDAEDKRRALELMVDQLEPDPGPVKERLLKQGHLDAVGVVRVNATAWSGKENRAGA